MSDNRIVALPAAGVEESDAKATVQLIEAAHRSLVEAQTLPDIRRVMEAASVAADAAQRAAKLAQAHRMAAEVVDAAGEVANEAAAVRIEAQAKAGELLREMREQGERAKGGEAGRRESQAATLDDLGVTASESSRWQQVAAVPADQRAEYVAETKAARGEVSTAGLLRHSSAAPAARAGRQQGPTTAVDHAAVSAEARKHARAIYRELLALPGFRPESLVAALDNPERKHLLRALDQLTGWIEDVKRELSIGFDTKEVER